MYSYGSNLFIGFHGCDQEIRNKIINNPSTIKKSEKPYDWLGHGFYVWENNYERALQWAKDKKTKGKIKTAAVLGVVYHLGNCLDFTDSRYIDLIGDYFEQMKKDYAQIDKHLPQNRNQKNDLHKDLLIRELDCSVIEYMHQKIEDQISSDNIQKGFSHFLQFDTVRGVFTEGGPAFEGAGIQKKNHIQICIRNTNCIVGFFMPKKDAG